MKIFGGVDGGDGTTLLTTSLDANYELGASMCHCS